MILAILRYKNGISRLSYVGCESNGSDGYVVGDYCNDGEKVFKFETEIRGHPVYSEIDCDIEEFYGYEKEESTY